MVVPLGVGELLAQVGLSPRRDEARAPQQVGDEQQDEHAGHQEGAPDGYSEGRERHMGMLSAPGCRHGARDDRAGRSGSGHPARLPSLTRPRRLDDDTALAGVVAFSSRPKCRCR